MTTQQEHINEALHISLAQRQTLADQFARHRDMQRIPVSTRENHTITLSPGAHSDLIRLIIEVFAPHFVPGYVTAFPDRGETMRKFLSVVAWETEVWCASDPAHLIHFNGVRFLEPYGC